MLVVKTAKGQREGQTESGVHAVDSVTPATHTDTHSGTSRKQELRDLLAHISDLRAQEGVGINLRRHCPD